MTNVPKCYPEAKGLESNWKILDIEISEAASTLKKKGQAKEWGQRTLRGFRKNNCPATEMLLKTCDITKLLAKHFRACDAALANRKAQEGRDSVRCRQQLHRGIILFCCSPLKLKPESIRLKSHSGQWRNSPFFTPNSSRWVWLNYTMLI